VPQAAREGDERATAQRTGQVGEGACHHVAGELDKLIAGTCTENGEELVQGGAACPGWCTTSYCGDGGGAWRAGEERFVVGRSPEGAAKIFFSFPP
jgi:hypothetical protein